MAAHLDAEVRGKRQFGAARHAAVAIAIALAAAEGRGDRRNAVGGEALTAEAPAQQSRAAADRGARADRVARTGLDVDAAFQRLIGHISDDIEDKSEERRVGKECVRTSRNRWA